MGKTNRFDGLKPKPRVVQPKTAFTAMKSSALQPAPQISSMRLSGDPTQTGDAKSANLKLTRIVKKKVENTLKQYQPQPLRQPPFLPSGQLMEHLFRKFNSDTLIYNVPVVAVYKGGYGNPVISSPNSLRAVAAISIKADNTSPFQVGWEWLTGTGPRVHKFTNGDHFTMLLQEHEHVAGTREIIRNLLRIKKGKLPLFGHNSYALGGVQGVPKYFRDYTTLLTFGVTGNLAVTYLGSYTLEYYVESVDKVNHTALVRFCAGNSSTIASATHPPVIGYTPWWNQPIGTPLNNIFQAGLCQRQCNILNGQKHYYGE